MAGEYFYADRPIFVSKMTKELILDVLNDIIKSEPDLNTVFQKIDFVVEERIEK